MHQQPGSCHFFDDNKMQDANPYTPKNGGLLPWQLVPQQATFTYAETLKLVQTAVAFHEGVNTETARRFQESTKQMIIDHKRECETLKAQKQQSSVPPLHFASENATALWGGDFAKTLEEQFKSPAKALQEPGSPMKKQRTSRLVKTNPTVNPTEALESVLEALATVNPFWHVTSFTFESPEDAVRFWKEVCASSLFHGYSEATMNSVHSNPARKVLKSLGYTDAPFGKQRTLTKARQRPGEETERDLTEEAQWQKLVHWNWNMRMALRNCYWFWTLAMDVNTKKMLDLAFAEASVSHDQTQPNDTQDAFSFVSETNIQSLHRATFRFETEAVGRPKVLSQIVFLSSKLNEFVQKKQIVNLKYAVARPEQHAVRECLTKYSNQPGMCLSATSTPAAECGGASICKHQRRRSTCKECRAEADESMPAGLEELGEDARGAGGDGPLVP